MRRGRSDRTTLFDVAKKAGVSPITVSRVLREPGKVSPELRGRILELIEVMGYVPDQAARALASKHNSTFGVLISAMTNPAFISFMRGIEERVRDTDFRVQYANTHYCVEEEKRQVRLLLSQNTAGIILAGMEGLEQVAELLKQATCPVVQVVDVNLESVGASVSIDHTEAAATATEYLLKCGYRRIAFFGGTSDERGRRRSLGYSRVMKKAGLFQESLIYSENNISAPAGVHLLHAALQEHPDLDAVLCQIDELALGVLFEAQRIGKRVPEDFGICGYNDLQFAAITQPPLTTIRVPLFEMGYRAADLVIRDACGQTKTRSVVNMGFELIARGTTRPPRAVE
ncbi:LacI family DNA-binding transcriptional regulator [Rhizobium helianthi]|uniref:LacI family DNA-binding transcriptional regulator n=1 Tax=Rhizobium helianthi TaxID=1132695 RepID=A0ABW4M2Y0_9HYPH